MSINNSEVDKKIQKAAAILKIAYDAVKNQNTTTKDYEKEVIKKYGDNGGIFSNNNLNKDENLSNNNLNKHDFIDFFKNNHHWEGIDRPIYNIMKNCELSKITQKLSELLYGDKEIDTRFDNFNEIKGFGKATITPLLLVTHPKEYGVWNEVSEWCLKTLGIWLITYDNKSKGNLTQGEIYFYVNDILLKLKSCTGLSLWKLDATFMYYYNTHKNEICHDLIENKKYSKKDLSDIFTPEINYTSNGGKWGRTGVVSLDLGKEIKYYFLFSIYENFSKLKRPEIVADDGTFDWATQKNMINKNTPLVKKLKQDDLENPIILLFIKKREEDKFTYFGPLKFLEDNMDKQGNRRFIYKLLSWTINEEQYTVPTNPSENAELEMVQTPNFYSGGNNKKSKLKKPFKVSKQSNYEENKKLGDAGEELVYRYETDKLQKLKVNKTPEWKSRKDDTLGYDILSYDQNGNEIYIEVKTTRGKDITPFFISSNEYIMSNKQKCKYILYRLFNYNPYTGAQCYKLVGPLEQYNPVVSQYTLEPK